MATVEVFTKARMQAIEDEAIVDSRIDIVGEERQLILIRNNGVEINAGNVRGPIGITPTLPTIPDELDWNAAGQVYGAGPVGGAGVPTLKMMAGTSVITTNNSGAASIWYPEAFNGTASVILQIGDNVDIICTYYAGTTLYGTQTVPIGNVNLIPYAYYNDHVTFTVKAAGGITDFGTQFGDAVVGASTGIRVNWMAFGW